MTLRIQSFLTGVFALIMTMTLGLDSLQGKPSSGDISFLSRSRRSISTLSNWRHWIILTIAPKSRRSAVMPQIRDRHLATISGVCAQVSTPKKGTENETLYCGFNRCDFTV